MGYHVIDKLAVAQMAEMPLSTLSSVSLAHHLLSQEPRGPHKTSNVEMKKSFKRVPI